MDFFNGCVALITGASSGIGAELARQIAPHARCLFLVARRRERLDGLRSAIGREGLTIHCLSADLAEESQRAALVAQIQATGERITFLVNNAGLGDHGPFAKSDWSRVHAMIDVNITALTRLTHAFLPDLIASQRGAILNLSSIAGLLPVPEMSVYAASKAFVTSFSEALRAELHGSGVSVTTVCPGPVDTEFSSIADRASADEAMFTPDFFKVPAAEVVREALRAVARGRARIIPGTLVCIVMTFLSLVPIFILRLFLTRRRRTARELQHRTTLLSP